VKWRFSTWYLEFTARQHRPAAIAPQLTVGRRAGIARPMGEPHSLHPAQALMARETVWRRGTVPPDLDGIPVAGGGFAITGDAFLLRTESDHAYLYRRGEGVIIERPEDADPNEEMLWFNGSVYAAIASLNGLMPIHASAIAHEGRVHAFTGPSGAGKSTLAAGLGQHGLPLFADDTLLLDLSEPDRVLCLPGHKRLKLTGEALELTGSVPEEEVGAETGKHYASPPAGHLREVLPLARLSVLAEGAVCQFEPLGAGERIALLGDDHYTADLFALARGLDRSARFTLFAGLATRIPMERFTRPRDPARFMEGIAAMSRRIAEDSLP
jgi:hypothetical protein